MSKEIEIKNKIVNSELNLDYDKAMKFNISVQAVVNKLDEKITSAADKQELQNMIALNIASIALNDMGLPSIHEILETHYPEALL